MPFLVSEISIHPYLEEVYIMEGGLYDTTLDKEFTTGMYACRPPGMRHGPYISPQGCTMFVSATYSEKSSDVVQSGPGVRK